MMLTDEAKAVLKDAGYEILDILALEVYVPTIARNRIHELAIDFATALLARQRDRGRLRRVLAARRVERDELQKKLEMFETLADEAGRGGELRADWALKERDELQRRLEEAQVALDDAEEWLAAFPPHKEDKVSDWTMMTSRVSLDRVKAAAAALRGGEEG